MKIQPKICRDFNENVGTKLNNLEAALRNCGRKEQKERKIIEISVTKYLTYEMNNFFLRKNTEDGPDGQT